MIVFQYDYKREGKEYTLPTRSRSLNFALNKFKRISLPGDQLICVLELREVEGQMKYVEVWNRTSEVSL